MCLSYPTAGSLPKYWYYIFPSIDEKLSRPGARQTTLIDSCCHLVNLVVIDNARFDVTPKRSIAGCTGERLFEIDA